MVVALLRAIGMAAAVAVVAVVAGCGDSKDAAALCLADATAISTIQGADAASPLAGQTVVVRGAVTAHYRGNEERKGGYFLQAHKADQDDDPRTSEGLFVIADSLPKSGAPVAVQGTVTELGDVPMTLTALAESARGRCEERKQSPQAVTVSLPGVTEAHEAMLVHIAGELTIADVYELGRAGRLRVASGGMVFAPTEVAEPGVRAREIARRNALRSLVIDDGSAQSYPQQIGYLPREISLKTLPRVGDKLSGIVGVIDGREVYHLHPISRMTPVSRQREQRFSPPGGQLSVAALNLHNFMNGDGLGGGFPTERGADSPREYERQRQKLVLTVMGMGLPDVLAVSEVENDGYGPNSAIADLVAAVNARIRAPRDTYGYAVPAVDRLGDDSIAVGLIYRRDKVRPIGPARTIQQPPFDDLNRPPLAQTFEVLRTGEVVTVVAVHLKSKRCGDAAGPDADQRDGQGCYNATRTRAAEYLANWVATDPTGSGDPDVLLIGDFNAYSREDPIRALAAAGYVDLISHFHEQPRYSFIFRGAAGRLDHALASPTLSQQARGARIWHINAAYTAWLDYNLEGKSSQLADALYSESAVRSSDHDPLVVGFQ